MKPGGDGGGGSGGDDGGGGGCGGKSLFSLSSVTAVAALRYTPITTGRWEGSRPPATSRSRKTDGSTAERS